VFDDAGPPARFVGQSTTSTPISGALGFQVRYAGAVGADAGNAPNGGGTYTQSFTGSFTITFSVTEVIGTAWTARVDVVRNGALTIVNDTIAEDPETVTLGIAGIVSPGAASIGAQSSTTLTIQDNDTGGTVEFASTAVSVAENVAGGKATLTVKRTSPSAAIPLASGVLVDYAVAVGGTAGAGDFTLAAGTLTFAAGQTSAPILVTILNDAVPEANKTVVVTLSNPRSTGLASGANKPMLGASTTATLTIVDEEPRLAFAAAAFSVAEGASVLVPVVRTGPATGTVSPPRTSSTSSPGSSRTACSSRARRSTTASARHSSPSATTTAAKGSSRNAASPHSSGRHD
jgi:hypothetical protein